MPFPFRKKTPNKTTPYSLAGDGIIILEDNPDRLRRMLFALKKSGLRTQTRAYYNAYSLLKDLPRLLPRTGIISLDHDLVPLDANGKLARQKDWGNGLIIAEKLAKQPPTATVLLHTSRDDKATEMADILIPAGWKVLRAAPSQSHWVEQLWLPGIRASLTQQPNNSR